MEKRPGKLIPFARVQQELPLPVRENATAGEGERDKLAEAARNESPSEEVVTTELAEPSREDRDATCDGNPDN